VQVSERTRTFGDVTAVDYVTLAVNRAEIFQPDPAQTVRARARSSDQRTRGFHRVQGRRRPGQARLDHEPCAPGRQCDRHQFFAAEVISKVLDLLHELVPKAVRIAVLVNPTNTVTAESTLRDGQETAPALGLQVQAVEAGSIREIEAVFETIARERAEALFIGPDAFLISRRVQLAILAARHGIPTASNASEAVEVGQLMSYGTDAVDTYRQVGTYAGRLLKGGKPAEMPVQQSTKFEFVINLSTANTLGFDIPPALLLHADEVIE
jgi:putative ABC transport system substrate-binding protein